VDLFGCPFVRTDDLPKAVFPSLAVDDHDRLRLRLPKNTLIWHESYAQRPANADNGNTQAK
jgi:hypothetical protein